ncbi:pseudaminic acid CMP-transferase [Desulfovibrio sp. X2]|uniref:pseudaminic acid cytidylyltransferase n=1 Tax=Desulfovibrio sp. X2 TaxID=941449 RepID=UPI000358DB10|nr:pseudaminic acid cytidylyltransferase [Desulfovibrio sp. X2]EPR37162.1 pseudaminic acid CMP-transferase [Desulfovibrio sp. X2]
MRSIAIITARGGSKRIPRKNIREFRGRPMIAWPIAAALESGVFDHVLVSTDDAEIAEVARACGAEAPFLRPAALADDFAHAHKAARHALEWAIEHLASSERPVEAFCHLYPTAPLLSAATVREGLRVLSRKGVTNVYAAQRVPFPIYQVVERRADGGLRPLFPPEKFMMRSQDMPACFIDVGQMYWFRTAHFLEHETRIGSDTALVEVPQETALDIDTEDDWKFAEKLAALARPRG